MLRESPAVVAIGPLIIAADSIELAVSARVQRDDVLVLDVDVLDDVDLADRVLVEVVGPAVYHVSPDIQSNLEMAKLTTMARHRTGFRADAECPQS